MGEIETERLELPRNEISVNATSLQLRAGGTLNKAAVEDYRLAYQEGRELPPLKVCKDRGKYYLFDGYHRFEAALGVLEELPCIVYHCDKKTAQWLAIAENVSHGLRRSGSDKRRAVEAALNHPNGMKLSDAAIAEHAGVSDRFVAKVRKELSPESPEIRVGKDGREIKVSNIGKRPTPNSSESNINSPPEPTVENADDDAPDIKTSLESPPEDERDWPLDYIDPFSDDGYPRAVDRLVDAGLLEEAARKDLGEPRLERFWALQQCDREDAKTVLWSDESQRAAALAAEIVGTLEVVIESLPEYGDFALDHVQDYLDRHRKR